MKTNILEKFFHTDLKDYASMILRLALGIFFFSVGGGKMFGFFGGSGFEMTIGFYVNNLGIPYLIAFLAILAEGFGSIALILGFFTRFVALSLFIVMIGAIWLVHFKNGFFDYQIQFLIISICMALIIRGGGALSIDGILQKLFTDSL